MRSSDIKGLAVFSIVEGKEIGTVKDLVINAANKAVEYLLVENPSWYFGISVIPFKMVEGIGSDAVVVESESLVKKVQDEPAALELVQQNIRLINNRVLTKKGRIIGQITEFHVDEESGQVTGCELADQQNTIQGIIPTNVFVVFGKDILVVKDDVEKYFLSDISELEDQKDPAMIAEPDTIPDKSDNANEDAEKSEKDAQSKTVELFKQKQRDYLIGRTANKDIIAANGSIIVRKGEVITAAIVDKAELEGKFQELVLNV